VNSRTDMRRGSVVWSLLRGGEAKVNMMAKSTLGHDANGVATRLTRARSLCGAFWCTAHGAGPWRGVPLGASASWEAYC
jgi:hypothetical protein